MAETHRILLFADSHLGFDLARQPRVERPRRGEDLFRNYNQVITFAIREKVDLIVHGGDIFHRSGPGPALVERAYRPLYEAACRGIPVFIVPGNHERSRLPAHLYLSHENLSIFERPATFIRRLGGKVFALSGFPFSREARENFPRLLEGTGYREAAADCRLLCAHQTFEGATVGPVDYTFRQGRDNIPPQWVPAEFEAVLSGHIHRAQQLERSLDGDPLAAPVIYPGSIERTSIAERFENKSFKLIQLSWVGGEIIREVETHPLPTRPMLKVSVPVEGHSPEQVLVHIRGQLSLIRPDAVVRVELSGRRAQQVQEMISAASLRAAAPPSMNISFGLKLAKTPG